MPSNRYTDSIINSISAHGNSYQSISPDELEFQDYVTRQFSTPVANNHREQEKQNHVYRCPCGLHFTVGRSKHIQGPIFYDNTGAAVTNCPKCDRVLGGEVKAS